jgi:hypothetical protein
MSGLRGCSQRLTLRGYYVIYSVSRVSLESAIKPRASHNNLRLQPHYILHFKVARLYDF